MNKNDTIKAIEKFVSSQEMTMFRLKKGIYGDAMKNLDQVFTPYKEFAEFFKNTANRLQELLGNIAYESILNYTEAGLSHCEKIHSIYFVESKGFFKSGLKYIEPDATARERAKSYYDKLLENNEKLNEYIDIGLQRLHGLEAKVFE